MSNLEANLRSETSKGNNNILRKQGMVPAVLYGGDEKNELISVSKKHLKTYRFLRKVPDKKFFLFLHLDY